MSHLTSVDNTLGAAEVQVLDARRFSTGGRKKGECVILESELVVSDRPSLTSHSYVLENLLHSHERVFSVCLVYFVA